MYHDTVTIFNTKDGTTWYPTVLRNVDVNTDKAAILAKYGANAADNCRLHIKYRTSGGVDYVGEKQYKPPKEWKTQTDNSLSSTITFEDGNNFSFFYVGDWGSESVIADSSYGVDGFFDYMNRTHDNVFVVTKVAKYSVIPHFEIMGK